MLGAVLQSQSHVQRHIRRWMLVCLLGIMSGPIFGQQPGMQLPHPQVPDETTPNTNTKHNHHPTPTKEVAEKLRKGFDSKNAAYTGSNIQAAVDDQSVTLNGTVKSEMQREMAMQLAQAYADDRKIVDRLVVQ